MMVKRLRTLVFALGVYMVLLFAFFTFPVSAFWGRTLRKMMNWHDRS